MADGTKILFILIVINVGLVALNPVMFIGENEVFTRVASTFGMNIQQNQTLDGSNITMLLVNSTTNKTGDELGLSSNTTSRNILSAVTTFFSPVLFIIDFIRLLYSFAFAPITLLGKMGLPWFIKLIFGLPLAILYIVLIANWLRGVSF